MGGLWRRFLALSLPIKILLALVVLGAGIVLSPLMVVLAALTLVACLLVLLLCVLTRRTASRTWGLAALASFSWRSWPLPVSLRHSTAVCSLKQGPSRS